MKYFGEGLSEQHKKLQHMIRKEQELEAAKELFLSLHAALHASAVSEMPCNEVDALLQDLQEYEYAIMPTREAETIAWVIWHIARIEDLTMHILVETQVQARNPDWKQGLQTGLDDSANASTEMKSWISVKRVVFLSCWHIEMQSDAEADSLYRSLRLRI